MSTIGGLLLPQFKPYDLGGTLEQANRIAGGVTNNQTALLQLADLKAKQQAEQLMLERIKNDPALARQLFGGSVLGSLGPAGGGPGGPPGGMPLTQQAVMPGQPPGPPQMVPGGQDLSRYAQVSPQGGGPIPPDVMAQVMPTVTPPQSTIASLGPPGQGPPQAPPHPLLEMARQDPRAALLLQQQMQAQQDRQWKMQEQQLGMGVKVAEFVARELQGVTDQASLDVASERIRQVHPQAAAQVPQMYSKEAVQALQGRGFSVVERAKADLDAFKLRLTEREQQLKAANIPNYTGDAKLDAIIYTKMKAQPPGTMPSPEIVEAAYKQRETDILRVSQEQGAAQEAMKPLGETATLRFNTLTQAEDTVKKLMTEFTPEERRKFVGMGGMSFKAEQLRQLAADATGGKADPKFARFAALVALAKAEAFSTAGKALTDTEAGVVYGYIPTGKEYSAEEFEQKLTLAQERIPGLLDRELTLATTPRSALPGMRARGELGTPSRAPTRAGSTTLTPASQMTREEIAAEIAAIKARGGR